jgi:S-formylglutathione hydrolase FrmB
MPTGPLFQLLCATLPTVVLSGCSGDDVTAPPDVIEWNAVPTPLGSVNVAVVRPTDEGTQNHPVIFALPWGSGTDELVEAFIQRYWQTEPATRGYYVVAPAIFGPSLEADAGEIIPALFDWMQAELSMDATSVAIVGASNGGRGLFFTAVTEPDRFQALLALPGMYQGDPANLAVLAGKPIRMIVGEFDDVWREGLNQTVIAFETQGITPEVDIAGTQSHVLDLDPVGLLNWIDNALGR